MTNAAVYYLFDRDSESNTDSKFILDLLTTLKNSQENENNMMGGLLILSYPSIEAYEVSNFIDDSFKMDAKLGSDVKEYIYKNAKQISMNKIDEDSVIHGCMELMQYMRENNIEFDIDNISDASIKIFGEEEKYFQNNQTYFLLSMMSCILLDLGILREESEK